MAPSPMRIALMRKGRIIHEAPVYYLMYLAGGLQRNLSRSKSFHHFQIGCAANPCHFCPKKLCELYCICANTSRCAVDHDFLSALDFSFSKQAQCCGCTDWNGGRFLVSHIDRFYRHHPLFRQTFIFGVGAKILCEGRGKHLVTCLEPCYVFADCLHFTGEFHSKDWLSWFSETQGDSSGEPEHGRHGKTSHSPVPSCDGGRAHLYQDFVILGSRFFNLFELKDFR